MKRAAIYARVSTADQAQTNKLSMPDQLLRCRRAAKSDGFQDHEITEYRDDGVSGELGEDDRPQFGRLMRDVRAGSVKAVYFLDLDRFARDMVDALVALKEIEKHGASFKSLQDPYIGNHLVRAMTAAMAQMERAKIRERTLPRKLAKRDSGLWVVGSPPYGYRLTKTTKVLTQCPNEAPVLRRIFELAEQGIGRTQIARKLNQEGIFGPEIPAQNAEGKRRRIRVGHVIDDEGLLTALAKRGLTPANCPEHVIPVPPQWASSSVAKVLSNTMAYGYRNGVKFAIEPSPIIGEAEFRAVQAMMASRRVQRGSERGKGLSTRWRLTGFLKCAGCGSNYVHHRAKGHDRYCCGARRSGQMCRNPNVVMSVADTAVIETLRQWLWGAFPPTSDKFREHLQKQTRGRVYEFKARHKTVSAELEKAEAVRKGLEARWVAGRDLGLSAEAIADTVAELKAATATCVRLSDDAGRLRRQMTDLNAGLVAEEGEINELSERMRHAIMVVGDDGATLDLRRLLSILLRSATVQVDGTIAVDLRDQAATMPDVLELLRTTELERQRLLRFVAAS
jgi:site-specific DNA recombinase